MNVTDSDDVDLGKPVLRRMISGPMLVFYGLGTMLGAGVYALIGEVAGAAGRFAPLSFVVAALVAGFTAISFAELSSRFPKSAGEAVYVSEGFGNRRLSLVVGLLIAASGVVSAGVMFQGLVGYAGELAAFPKWVGLVALAVLVGGVAAWGIAESVKVVAAVTILEVAALFVIIAFGFAATPAPIARDMDVGGPGFGVIAGAVLAFYAFIGFEDMVNVAEEVKRPRRALPISIILALGSATLIYVLVAWAAVRSIPIAPLADSEAPMALIFARLTGASPIWMSLVAMIALINGALVQIVMASRVLYGLANQKMVDGWFGQVSRARRTPVNATFFVSGLVLLGALLLPLATLAKLTTFLLLIVFTLVNCALIVLKRRGPSTANFNAPTFTPYLGAASAAAFALLSLVAIFS